MRKIGLVVLVGGALALVIWWRSLATGPTPPAGTADRSSSLGEAHTAHGPGPGSAAVSARPGEAPQSQVRRLTSDDRRRLGEQIAAARQRARAAEPSTATGSADDDFIPVEQVGKPLKDGLTAAIHLLADCYPQQPGGDAMRDATALMTMTSDPELGTVIDTDEIKDAAGNPVAPKLDECLRDTIDSLALPPLGKRGKVHVQYTFKFD
jgi:hypothetical protein